MPRPRTHLDDWGEATVTRLADLVLTARAIDSAHAADRAALTAAIRETASALPPGARGAALRSLANRGVRASESLLRKWASQSAPTDPPTWWEVIDHRDPDELQRILERALGMAVDVDSAPVVRVPVTAAQVAALREALPDAVIGPLGE